MADTQITKTAALALLANNTAGAISPADLRSAMVSWQPGSGQMYVAAADAAAITIGGTTLYYECTAPAWTLSAGAYLFSEADGNGRLTYTGVETVRVLVSCMFSMTVDGLNDVLHWRLGVNGSSDASSEIQRKVGTGADVGAAGVQLLTQVAPGDHISLFVRNESAADDVTLETATLTAVTMIQ